MKFLRSCFERENKRWEQILASPQKLEEHLSRRLDSDKIIFSPRLNPSQMDALRNAQTAEAIRLQQLYSEHPQSRSVHRGEAEIFRAEAQRELCLAARWTAHAEGRARCRKTRRRRRPPFAAGNAEPPFQDQGGNTAPPTNATRRFTGSTPMPIESPSPIGSKTHSEFVLCEGFAFRPSNVDGCSHQKYADGSAVTVVNFKSYTQTIPDPERRLFDFLIRKLKPKRADESE